MNSLRLPTIGLLAALAAASCHGDSGGSYPAGGTSLQLPMPPTTPTAPGALEMRVTDVTSAPIQGAVVTVASATALSQAITDSQGRAELASAPGGEVTVSVSASGFETATFATRFPNGVGSLWLRAEGEWAVGRAISLGARLLERADDGSTLTFSIDVAVIGASSLAIENLTSANFEVFDVDCGWGGPRDCASDSSGKPTAGGGQLYSDGGALAFGLQPPSARRPYLVGVLTERSGAMGASDARAAGLRSFFAALGGNDQANLAAVELFGGTPTLTVFGPFTSDGRAYFNAIDALSGSENDPPAILSSVGESIRSVAAARDSALTPLDATVLVVTSPSRTIADFDGVTALARQLGVRVSAVAQDNYGLPEIAVQTGGFVAEYSDPRQLGLIFGAMDSLLAGTMPYYRLEFRVKGRPGVFVAGGNAKVRLRVRVPTPLPSNGSMIVFDVPIDF